MAEQKKLHPTVHRQIVIEERNKEILHLKTKLRLAKKLLRELRPLVAVEQGARHMMDGLPSDITGESTEARSARVRLPIDDIAERMDLFLA